MAKQACELRCKYCGEAFTLRCQLDELRFYMKVCPSCVEDDAPGMARYEKMADMMGTAWAIDHA